MFSTDRFDPQYNFAEVLLDQWLKFRISSTAVRETVRTYNLVREYEKKVSLTSVFVASSNDATKQVERWLEGFIPVPEVGSGIPISQTVYIVNPLQRKQNVVRAGPGEECIPYFSLSDSLGLLSRFRSFRGELQAFFDFKRSFLENGLDDETYYHGLSGRAYQVNRLLFRHPTSIPVLKYPDGVDPNPGFAGDVFNNYYMHTSCLDFMHLRSKFAFKNVFPYSVVLHEQTQAEQGQTWTFVVDGPRRSLLCRLRDLLSRSQGMERSHFFHTSASCSGTGLRSLRILAVKATLPQNSANDAALSMSRKWSGGGKSLGASHSLKRNDSLSNSRPTVWVRVVISLTISGMMHSGSLRSMISKNRSPFLQILHFRGGAWEGQEKRGT
mmetsp:Transcript_38812/g.76296  ORF Transcript_38812/g.76296 Transcript_38812/m.76296 type:complete len:383 (+) Transcript_38812:74-1222(+)